MFTYIIQQEFSHILKSDLDTYTSTVNLQKNLDS